MKTSLLCILASLPATAFAENMMTAGSLSAGDLGLDAEVQAGVGRGNALTFNLHQAVGLKGGFDLFVREDLGITDDAPGLYIGAGVKWTVLSGRSGSRPGIAFLFGGHFFTDIDVAGADAAFIIDMPIGGVTPFATVDTNLEFFDNNTEFVINVGGGARVSIVRNVSWFIEGAATITDGLEQHFISTGLKISL